MGQVVELMPYTARVLLLTDTTHSIPVQVNRNGLRAIASGTGNPERLELRHVADTADIKEGDLLVSSGMGQRFPAGYPVATVNEVIHDSGQPFAIVRAIPTAALNRSRYMLLVFSDRRSRSSVPPMPPLPRKRLTERGLHLLASRPLPVIRSHPPLARLPRRSHRQHRPLRSRSQQPRLLHLPCRPHPFNPGGNDGCITPQ